MIIQPCACAHQRSVLLLAGMLVLAGRGIAAETSLAPESRWESEIAAFERADRTNPPPKDAVLLIGSSSIKFWTTAGQQLPGHPVINRGFGGSELSDCTAFAERIVIPYRPRLIALCAGENDIVAGKTPERVRDDFRAFVTKVRSAGGETKILYLAIKPSPARAKQFQRQQTANELIRKCVVGDSGLSYVDVRKPMLKADGKPREDLFLKDGVHLNEEGYRLWAGILRPVLDQLDPPGGGKR